MKLITNKTKLMAVLLLSLLGSVSVNAQLSFALSNGSAPCYNSSTSNSSAYLTGTVVGATSYSWSIASTTCNPTFTVGGTSLLMNFPCAGSHTITCYAINGTSTLSTVSQTLQMLAGASNTVTTAPMLIGCAGTTFTFTNMGSVSYTCYPGNISGSTIAVTPTATTCYTLVGTASSGCTTQAVRCLTINPNPTVTITGGGLSVCLNQQITLTASGANSYTWNTGSNTASISPILTGALCYTVLGSNTFGCAGSATTCFTYLPGPTVTATGPTGTICQGSVQSYTATGAASYTWYASGPTPATGSIVSIPTYTDCVTVVGTGTNGCVSGTAHCMGMFFNTPITVTPSSTLVCEGTSFIYTAAGAASYVWNTGATTSTITAMSGNFAAYTPIAYTVTGTYANGCTSAQTVTPWMITYTCSNVWPGDANRDGVADNLDVFELGLWSGSTGNPRVPASSAWAAQYALNWGQWTTMTVSTGWDRSHADCNGDGVINAADTLPIFNNYLLTHSFKTSEALANGDINIVATQANEGLWNKADIVLGSSANQINQLYGVAFDVDFDNSLVETNSAYIVYTPSFLNAANQNVQFRKTVFNSGKVYAASVRINNSNVSGDGKIGEFWYKVKNDVPANSTINLSITLAKKTNNTGVISPLTSGSSAVSIVKTVGLNQSMIFDQALQLYPNPAANQLTLQSELKTSVAYTVCDVIGREVMKGEFAGSKTVDISDLKKGTYIVRLESGSSVSHKKLLIEK